MTLVNATRGRTWQSFDTGDILVKTTSVVGERKVRAEVDRSTG